MMGFKTDHSMITISVAMHSNQRGPGYWKMNTSLLSEGIRQSDLCTFCKTEAESLIHLFWCCRVTSLFWQEFKQWIATNHETAINDLSSATVLGLKPYAFNKKICGHFLLARYYIWISRTQEKTLSLDNFLILQHSFGKR